MVAFFIKRLLWVPLVVLAVTVLTFLLSQSTGHPEAAYVTEHTPPEVVQQVIERYRLDAPPIVQYWWYLRNLLRGDWGISRSASNLPVLDAIATYFPATLELSILAILIALMIALPLGVMSAVKRNSWVDSVARVVSLAGVSLPIFILALMLQYVLFFQLQQAGLFHFPLGGRVALRTAMQYPLRSITGMYVFDSLITGNWPFFFDALRHLALPAFSLAFASVGLFTRITRTSMLEVMSADYVKVARAKGLRETRVIWTHAFRSALIPVITVVGLQMGRILGGTVIVETVFYFPGLGLWAVSAITASDSASIMGFVLVVAVVRTVLNLITDFFYTLLDPRIRYQ